MNSIHIHAIQQAWAAQAARLPRLVAWLVAVLVPVAYLWLYTPYGMDTTDFGFFYGYAWRIVQGEVPYRDFYYLFPSFALFWHALWIWLTPEGWNILGGKWGFVATMLAAAWAMTLYLNRFIDFARMAVPLPLMATAGFVWGVHTFAHVPWHTADGVLFASCALLAGASGWPALAGVLSGVALLTKQSFVFVPVGVALAIFVLRPDGRHWRATITMLAAFALTWGAWWLFLHTLGAWEAFRTLTTAKLDIAEAWEAGIFIYLRQPWLWPVLTCVPFVAWKLLRKNVPVPQVLQPAYIYLAVLAGRYIHNVFNTRSWIGFGESWPTLWLVLGGLCVLWPPMLKDWRRQAEDNRWPVLGPAVALGAALLVSWSSGISGGYKTPALCAVPLLMGLLLLHTRLGGKGGPVVWVALICGLFMFRVGYEYPYTFPDRSMPRSSLTYHAGEIFPKATGVYVDKHMYTTLYELRSLRAKYGPNYRVLPSFPHATYLTGDKPVFPSEWTMDWQILGHIDSVYQGLCDKKTTVFMLKDQMDATQADGYARTRYTLHHRVRQHWRILEETSQFVVFGYDTTH